MIQRKTQTEIYWREQFEVTSEDLSRVYDLVLDAGRPMPLAAIAPTLIEDRCRREEAQLQTELRRGPIYQPRDTYQVGQEIAFPAFGFAWGTVVGSRPASSPAFGEFTAIQVRLEGEKRVRELASGLRGEHKLNRAEGELASVVGGDLRSPQELFQAYGPAVVARLAASLAQHKEFVQFGEEWFLKELLVDVRVGDLNIAEALIEIKAMPLSTSDLVTELSLPAEVPEQIRLLSLKRALEADDRFENVGDAGREVWYLRRLMPEAVIRPPAFLALREEPYLRQEISKELLVLEREISEEGSGDDGAAAGRPVYRTMVVLTYPHWRAGTLPLTQRTQGLFPRPTAHRTPVVLLDGQSGDKMQGWVVPGSSIVVGLKDWYTRHTLPVGAYIKVERTRDPRVILVDLEQQRLRRVWVKIASVQEGALTFQMRKAPVSCGFDEQMILGDDEPEAIAALQAESVARGDLLFDIMIQLFPELIKLSPQATVHAKTVYSAVNVLRRTGAGPVFALLSSEPCFVPMGGGYWTFDETRI